jgi:hypothetical protein
MVRLINKDNIQHVIKLICFFVGIQDKMTYIAEYNNPNIFPCIYVMWHGNQFCVHGLPDRSKLNILVSNSLDGDLITSVCNYFGYQTCRGSSGRKGAISGTLRMINKLKEDENIAIMVDGPRGPLHTVKSGAITLAREANVPIIPVNWYSPNLTFLKFSSWDRMTCPFGPCQILNTYGNPIYVNDKSDNEVAQEIKTALLKLEQEAPMAYKDAQKRKLWRKKK